MLTFAKAKPNKSPKPETMDAEQIGEQIPRLKDIDTPLGRAAHAAGVKTQELRATLKDLRQRLDRVTGDSCSPGWRFRQEAVTQDAEAVANGASLETLECQTIQDPRSTLLRQIAAVEAAIPIAAQRCEELRFKLQREELEKLFPLGQKLGRDLVEAYQRVVDVLHRNQTVYAQMHSKGFDHTMITSTPWSVSARDEAVLFGGPGMLSLEAWIENRIETWKLDEEDRR